MKETRNGSTKVVRFKLISIWLPKGKPHKRRNLTNFKYLINSKLEYSYRLKLLMYNRSKATSLSNK